jgi:hypothetical protein
MPPTLAVLCKLLNKLLDRLVIHFFLSLYDVLHHIGRSVLHSMNHTDKSIGLSAHKYSGTFSPQMIGPILTSLKRIFARVANDFTLLFLTKAGVTHICDSCAEQFHE